MEQIWGFVGLLPLFVQLSSDAPNSGSKRCSSSRITSRTMLPFRQQSMTNSQSCNGANCGSQEDPRALGSEISRYPPPLRAIHRDQIGSDESARDCVRQSGSNRPRHGSARPAAPGVRCSRVGAVALTKLAIPLAARSVDCTHGRSPGRRMPGLTVSIGAFLLHRTQLAVAVMARRVR